MNEDPLAHSVAPTHNTKVLSGIAKPKRWLADPRECLAAIVAEHGESLAGLSRMLGHGSSYLQRFVSEGTPAALSAEDHRKLASYFGVEELALGIRDLWEP